MLTRRDWIWCVVNEDIKKDIKETSLKIRSQDLKWCTLDMQHSLLFTGPWNWGVTGGGGRGGGESCQRQFIFCDAVNANPDDFLSDKSSGLGDIMSTIRKIIFELSINYLYTFLYVRTCTIKQNAYTYKHTNYYSLRENAQNVVYRFSLIL